MAALFQDLDTPAALRALTELELPRVSKFSGEVLPPGSKSIANRALLLSMMAEGKTRLENLPTSDDVRVLLGALPELGVAVDSVGETGAARNARVITGAGGAPPAKSARLNLENAGTALRPLTAILAFARGEYLIDGNEHMQKRPIGDLVESLAELGVDIQCASGAAGGVPPITIRAKGFPGGLLKISGAVSSQFVTALLLAAPLAEDRVIIHLPAEPVSKPYIDLTIAMMRDFGVEVERDGYTEFRIAREARYRSPGTYVIEGDASAATYFWAAGALPGSGPVRVGGVGRESTQGDARFVEVLAAMGARVDYETLAEGGGIRVSPGAAGPRGMEVDMNAMPDAAMTLAVFALFAEGPTYIRNVANLRVKESERLRGLALELGRLGARVREESDALHITPPARIVPARIETYQDHRMAMAFALAAFGADIVIENPACVTKTYPEFFRDFGRLIN